ncbi:LysR family transcriptional regulator [Clavibacter tessellarius]|uniref:LysR family transcriptional regulator n=1 Tax=Clavibacter tessellarius TaxID=31965 RepID=UPI00324D6FBE
MMDIRTEHLRTLAAVIDTGTLDAAARALRLTPSAVSQRITALERSAGRVLLRRTRPATTTEAGDAVLRHARQVLLLERDLDGLLGVGDADAPRAGTAAVPVVVNGDSLASWLLPAFAALAAGTGQAVEVLREDEHHSSTSCATDPRWPPSRACARRCRAAPRSASAGCGTARSRPPPTSPRTSPTGPRRARWPWLRSSCSTARTRCRTAGSAAAARPPASRATTCRRPRSSSRPSRSAWAGACCRTCRARRLVASGALVPLDAGSHVDVALHWQRWSVDSPVLADLTRHVRAAAASLR